MTFALRDELTAARIKNAELRIAVAGSHCEGVTIWREVHRREACITTRFRQAIIDDANGVFPNETPIWNAHALDDGFSERAGTSIHPLFVRRDPHVIKKSAATAAERINGPLPARQGPVWKR